jgi:DNA-binding CsgD family transcriptional regulator
VALRGLRSARQAGRETSFDGTILANNAAEALVAAGHTAEAAALIDPLTIAPPDRDQWIVHAQCVEIDVLRGDIEAAARRWRQITGCTGQKGGVVRTREAAEVGVELALWAGRPGDALQQVRQVVALHEVPDLTISCGRLLVAGMRACASLAEQARARRDGYAARDALEAAGDLASWVEQMAGAPFTDHPYEATIPANRATWDAERTRLAGASDPAAWRTAAKTWHDLGWPHRAGYAWWRHAEAQLTAGQPAAAAATALQAAAAAADGHVPLLAQIRALAQRARIPLPAPGCSPKARHPPAASTPYGLTGRELAVLRLLAAGRTNSQIGAELYISPKTASVHVTGILRKLGVSNRVQAAALAERAGLLRSGSR